jgi:hypothetical protein
VSAFSACLPLKSAAQKHLTTCISAESTPYSTHYNFALGLLNVTQTNKVTLSNSTYFDLTYFDPTYFDPTYFDPTYDTIE